MNTALGGAKPSASRRSIARRNADWYKFDLTTVSSLFIIAGPRVIRSMVYSSPTQLLKSSRLLAGKVAGSGAAASVPAVPAGTAASVPVVPAGTAASVPVVPEERWASAGGLFLRERRALAEESIRAECWALVEGSAAGAAASGAGSGGLSYGVGTRESRLTD
jgi:hypothetical protein